MVHNLGTQFVGHGLSSKPVGRLFVSDGAAVRCVSNVASKREASLVDSVTLTILLSGVLCVSLCVCVCSGKWRIESNRRAYEIFINNYELHNTCTTIFSAWFHFNFLFNKHFLDIHPRKYFLPDFGIFIAPYARNGQ